MKEVKELLGGASMGGPGSLLKNIGTLGLVGDKIVNAIGGGEHKSKKGNSTMDAAIKHEMERHKESHRQRSEHGKY